MFYSNFLFRCGNCNFQEGEGKHIINGTKIPNFAGDESDLRRDSMLNKTLKLLKQNQIIWCQIHTVFLCMAISIVINIQKQRFYVLIQWIILKRQQFSWILNFFSNLYVLRKCKEWERNPNVWPKIEQRCIDCIINARFFSFNLILSYSFLHHTLIKQKHMHKRHAWWITVQWSKQLLVALLQGECFDVILNWLMK